MWYNEQLLGEQQEVLKALSGLPCVILKGSSSAACYPPAGAALRRRH